MLDLLPLNVMRLVLEQLPANEVVYGPIRFVSRFQRESWLGYMAAMTELVLRPGLSIQGASVTHRLQSLIIERDDSDRSDTIDMTLRIVLLQNAIRLKRVAFRMRSLPLAMLRTLQQECPLIQSLSMSSCDLTNRHLELLAGFHHLQSLDLSDNRRLTDAGIAYLSRGCSQLQVLDLSGNELITDRALELLTDHCPLQRSPRSADQRAFERLQALHLNSTSISNSGIELVRERCPHIEALTLNDCYQVSLYSTLHQALLMNSPFWPLTV